MGANGRELIVATGDAVNLMRLVLISLWGEMAVLLLATFFPPADFCTTQVIL